MTPYCTNSSGIIIPTEEFLTTVAELRAGCVVFLQPMSEDMAPFIRGGQRELTLQRTCHPKVGNMVLAQTTAGLVLHRVMHIEPDGSVTLMGDAFSWTVEHCSRGDIVARVIEVRDAETHRRRHLGSAWLWRHLLHLRPMLLRLYRVPLGGL